jgi:hypothetical protein
VSKIYTAYNILLKIIEIKINVTGIIDKARGKVEKNYMYSKLEGKEC